MEKEDIRKIVMENGAPEPFATKIINEIAKLPLRKECYEAMKVDKSCEGCFYYTEISGKRFICTKLD